MGLGGVAIAALPSMIHPKLSFSDSLGGVSFADSRLERNLNTFVPPALILMNSGQGHNTL